MSARLAWICCALLLLQCPGLDLSLLLSWPTLGLVVLSAFKLREVRRPADLRLVVLLQLMAVGLLAAQMAGLLAAVLQLLTAVLALAGLLAQELGGVGSLRALLARSLQLITAALPLALVLFLFLPRVGPLWSAGIGPAQRAITGLSPDLDPLGIAELVRNPAPAARVSFGPERRPPDDAYWRVLVHEQYDGQRWRRLPPRRLPLRKQRSLSSPPVPSDDRVLQWWTVEPSSSRAVPWDGASRPASVDLQRDQRGELRLLQAPGRQRSYRLQAETGPQRWQQQPPSPRDLDVPPGREPRLRALAQQWRSEASDVARLEAAEAWFRGQPFRYSLRPGSWSADGLDAFLFDQQVGFCGHYASALALLMRSAGVPARVVSGYQGGRLVLPISGSPYLDLRQSDAHAWTEVWLQGRGWQRIDPTTWVSSIDPEGGIGDGAQAGADDVGFWRWLQWQWWGLDLAWTQWWLGFDATTQQAWLLRLFGDRSVSIGWLVLMLAAAAWLVGLGLLRRNRRAPAADLMARSLRVLRQLGVEPLPGESFPRLCGRAAVLHPERAALLQAMATEQQQLAHARLNAVERRRHQRQWRRLRQKLAR